MTVDREQAELFAHDAAHAAALPEASIQNPILLFAPHDLVGVVARLRPFMGQLGTMPGVDLPDSHNAGDFGSFLLGAPHARALTPEQLALRSDGHMDIDAVRAGAILVCPVRIPGGGVYLGDMHALQGDGEIAGHTCDVSGTVTLQVHVLKGLALDGPVLLPAAGGPALPGPAAVGLGARSGRWCSPRATGSGGSRSRCRSRSSAPGPTSTRRPTTGSSAPRALLGISVPEVKNRATITGAIEIGRHPGVVQVTFRAPVSLLERCSLAGLAREQYGG